MYYYLRINYDRLKDTVSNKYDITISVFGQILFCWEEN